MTASDSAADTGRRRGRTPQVNLNLNVRGMSASATVAINERCNVMLAAGRDIYKLGLGQSPFPVASPVVEALRRHAAEKDYLPVKGLRRLRDAVADYHRRVDGIDRSGDDVLIGPGSKELMFLLQLVYYGDLVIPTPAWVSYAPQAKIIGRQVRLVSTRRQDEWRLSPEGLEALCEEDPGRPRLVVINYPSNPTGATYRLEELRALAKVAAKHRVLLLSDEIYGELHHKGQHVSIARFYPEGTIISSGLSKWCGAGGWRLGTFLFPPSMHWLLDAMASAASETYTSTAAPIQHAAVTAFQGGPEIDDYLMRSRRVLGALGRWTHRRLKAARLHCAKPTGAFYLFPDFAAHSAGLRRRGIETSRALVETLLDETGVAILPGSDFGREPSELTARMAYVDFDGQVAIDAAGQVPKDSPIEEPFLRQVCPKITTAVDKICAWLPND
ncbi:MAG: aminotransferase class I/II-fold pyridoxal phosphate-dependent enzyme [Myxococcota bacterium]